MPKEVLKILELQYLPNRFFFHFRKEFFLFQ